MKKKETCSTKREKDSLEEVNLALGGARLFPAVGQWSKVIDSTDDIVASLFLMLMMASVLINLLGRGVSLLKGCRAAMGPWMSDDQSRGRGSGSWRASWSSGDGASCASGTGSWTS